MTTPTHPLLPRPTNPVSQPIINSPFHEPDYHWDLDTSAKALNHVLDGRRESQNIPPVAGSRKLRGRIGLPGQFGAVWTPLKLGRVHTKRSASKMSANEMNPRKITSSFSKREKMRRNPFNRRNSLSISLRLLYISRSYSHG